MIDVCACLFLSSLKSTGLDGRERGSVEAAWERGSTTDAAAKMTFVHLLFFSRLQPFPVQ